MSVQPQTPFGGSFYKALIRETGWPQKRGIFRKKEVVPVDVVIQAAETLQDNGRMVGLLKPSLGIKLLGQSLGNRDWIAMPPDAEDKAMLDGMAEREFPTPPPDPFIDWNQINTPQFMAMIESAFLGAVWTGLQGGDDLRDRLESELIDTLEFGRQMSPEDQNSANVNAETLPQNLEQYSDIFQKEIFEHWEQQFGLVAEPPQVLIDFVHEHRTTSHADISVSQDTHRSTSRPNDESSEYAPVDKEGAETILSLMQERKDQLGELDELKAEIAQLTEEFDEELDEEYDSQIRDVLSWIPERDFYNQTDIESGYAEACEAAIGEVFAKWDEQTVLVAQAIQISRSKAAFDIATGMKEFADSEQKLLDELGETYIELVLKRHADEPEILSDSEHPVCAKCSSVGDRERRWRQNPEYHDEIEIMNTLVDPDYEPDLYGS